MHHVPPASSAVRPPAGRLGVLTVGLGAVATTFMAGVEQIRRGRAKPVGSLTQMARMRLGATPGDAAPLLRDVVPLATLDDLVFGAWDPIADDALAAARAAGVLDARDLDPVADFLRGIVPMPAAFDPRYVPRIDGPNVKRARSTRDIVEELRQDIRDFRARHELERVVMISCASTETHARAGAAHASLQQLERALDRSDDALTPSMLYAYAALMEGVPFANGAPNLTVDVPAMVELAHAREVPISGKDFKTGQTWLKTVIAPAIRARLLGLSGWFSMNILGNRDGEVLDDPASFRAKEESKLRVLDAILQPELFPELYGDYSHQVRINYYPPRGDNKEGWDTVDIFGWLGYPMQMKINFLCRDSILAAPIVLDLALFSDFAARAGMCGVQDWLSFYYKSPMAAAGSAPEHDFFQQYARLNDALRLRLGDEQGMHLDLEYMA
jgi:myo-inositol-1-phosphate synthase